MSATVRWTAHGTAVSDRPALAGGRPPPTKETTVDARRWATAGTVVGALALGGIAGACSSGADPEQDTEQEQEQQEQEQEQDQDQQSEQEQESDTE